VSSSEHISDAAQAAPEERNDREDEKVRIMHRLSCRNVSKKPLSFNICTLLEHKIFVAVLALFFFLFPFVPISGMFYVKFSTLSTHLNTQMTHHYNVK